jgi:hypothetical protein
VVAATAGRGNSPTGVPLDQIPAPRPRALDFGGFTVVDDRTGNRWLETVGCPRELAAGPKSARPARLDGREEPDSVVHRARGLVGGRVSRIRSPGGLQQFGDHDRNESANSGYDRRRREWVHSSPPGHTATLELDDGSDTAAYGRTGPATVRTPTTTRRPLGPGRLEQLRRNPEPDGHSVLRPPVQCGRDLQILRARTTGADEINAGRVRQLRSESELDVTKRARSRRHPGRALEHVWPAALDPSFTRDEH